MKWLFAVAVAFLSVGLAVGFYFGRGSSTALAGGATCSLQNGDVNADGTKDLSDAVTILGHLFLGSPTQLLPLCETQGSSGLPDTGQTQCYDCNGQLIPCRDCRGQPRPCEGFTADFLTLQDSLQRTGCPNDANRFTDHGDGTVTDNCTGLMWQKDTADVNSDGTVFGDQVTWCEALNYCHKLQFAGHDDWRLPNVRELQSIVDYGRSPSIDPVFDEMSNSYWTSTSVTLAILPGRAWHVNFFAGVVDVILKDDQFLVRAVRNNP